MDNKIKFLKLPNISQNNKIAASKKRELILKMMMIAVLAVNPFYIKAQLKQSDKVKASYGDWGVET